MIDITLSEKDSELLRAAGFTEGDAGDLLRLGLKAAAAEGGRASQQSAVQRIQSRMIEDCYTLWTSSTPDTLLESRITPEFKKASDALEAELEAAGVKLDGSILNAVCRYGTETERAAFQGGFQYALKLLEATEEGR